jgi:CRP/FNR family transcriptional regulator
VVRDRALCSALDDAELSALAGAARMRVLARGDVLALAGDDAPLCGNLIEGALKLVARARDGTEQVVALLFAGDFVGDVLGGPAAHDVVALTDTRVCLFPREVLADALDRYPRMERMLLERTLKSVEEARDRLLLARGSADARVAALLLQLVPVGGRAELPLSRGDMADALGLTIETVSRALTRLKAAGVIATEGRRGVVVPDRQALKVRAAS